MCEGLVPEKEACIKWVYDFVCSLWERLHLFGSAVAGIKKERNSHIIFLNTVLYSCNYCHNSFHFPYIKMLFFPKFSFHDRNQSQVLFRDYTIFLSEDWQTLWLPCTDVLVLHINLHLKFNVLATTLPNSSTIPNTLKKLPRNPCLDQQTI